MPSTWPPSVTVIGVDSSLEMLAVARAKVPGGEFREGDLHQLPVPDQHVDLVVCALALAHVPELGPVLAEFVCVLQPGGHLVISDSRNEWPIVKPCLTVISPQLPDQQARPRIKASSARTCVMTCTSPRRAQNGYARRGPGGSGHRT